MGGRRHGHSEAALGQHGAGRLFRPGSTPKVEVTTTQNCGGTGSAAELRSTLRKTALRTRQGATRVGRREGAKRVGSGFVWQICWCVPKDLSSNKSSRNSYAAYSFEASLPHGSLA